MEIHVCRRDRQTDRQTDKNRLKQTETETDRQRDRETDTQQFLVLVSDKSPQITIRKSKLKNGPEKQTHTAK